MASEIEVVAEGSASPVSVAGEDGLKDDVYTAAAYGDLEKLQRFVEGEGCSVSEPDGLGYYALQWAALNNRSAAARYIIEHGGDVSAADHTGQTALHWSAVRGAVQVAEILLQEGARVNAADLNGYQTAHVAAQYGQTAFLYHILTKWDADADTTDNDGRSPLHCLIITAPGCPIALGRNKWDFLMFLILETLAMLVTGAITSIRIFTDRTFQSSISAWMTSAGSHLGAISFLIMDSFLFLGVATLTTVQIPQISHNITTNEMANLMRYSYLKGSDGTFRNPYDRGVWKNCSSFLTKGYNEDMEQREQPNRLEGIGVIQIT